MTVLGAPLEFCLFGLTLLGVAVLHNRTLEVALTGLENILRLGLQESKACGGNNTYAIIIEECYGIYFFF